MQGLMDNDVLTLVNTAKMKSGNNWGTGVICYNPVTKKILLAKRTDTKNWGTQGGKVEVGETPLQGVVRECMEESNVFLKDIMLYGYRVNVAENGKSWVSFMFISKSFDDSDIKNQVTEMEPWEWVTVEDALSRDLFEPSRKSIELAQYLGLFDTSTMSSAEFKHPENGDTVCIKEFNESEMPRVSEAYSSCGHCEEPVPSYSYNPNVYPPIWD